jgi:hypothetical protein
MFDFHRFQAVEMGFGTMPPPPAWETEIGATQQLTRSAALQLTTTVKLQK